MRADVVDSYRVGFLEGLTPDPLITVSEWADKFRYLSAAASSEPGQWRTSRTPYLKEIMDELSPHSKTEEIVFIKGSQIGGSEAGINFLSFIIDISPGPIMAVQPTVDLGKRFSQQRIAPMIENCSRLRSKIKSSRSRDSGNTMSLKSFPGGVLVITGANSAVGLRSLPARYLFLDEIDAYPDDVDGEGDPISLARARTRTFARKKIFCVSTPTIDGKSKIDDLFQHSDQRKYYVPCPFCAEMQPLVWEQMRWETGDADSVRYQCAHCAGMIAEHHKTRMLAEGKWVTENPDCTNGVVGFHLSALYSPVGWYSWRHAVQEYELALKDEQKMRVFMNTVLGLPFKVRGDAPGWNRLWERRENYPLRVVPKGGLVLTAGVDVQKDRLEAEIVAWGRDKQSWSIDYRVFPGDTATEAPWRALADTLTDLFPHERTGVLMPIMMCAIDSGYNTTHVHSFARRQRADQVILTRGADALAVPVGQPKAAETVVGKRRTRRGLKTWPVGVSLLKQELYSWLRLETPAEGAYPAGFCHFPEYDPEFFRQLTAEELQTKRVSGQSRQMWVKTRERNEALDCRIYARAAAIVAGLDRWSDKKWTEIEESVGVGMPEPAPEAKTDPQTQEINPKRTIERRKSGYWRS